MFRLPAAAMGLAALVAPALAQNAPPVPSGIADGDVIEVEYDVISTFDFSFASPEAGQTTTITSLDFDADGLPIGDLAEFPGTIEFSTTSGNPATGRLFISANAGTSTSRGTSESASFTACDDASTPECTTVEVTIQVLTPPVVACAAGVPVELVGYDADGVGSGFGEHVEVKPDRTTGETPVQVDFTTCTLLAFDVGTGAATFAHTPTFIAPVYADAFFSVDDLGVLGDSGLPAGFLPDGPGAFALVEGDLPVGTDVLDVADAIVVAAVYGADGVEIARAASPIEAAERAAFLEALALFRNVPPVPMEITDGDIITVIVDTPKTIDFSFTSPEAGQTTTITLDEVVAGAFPGSVDLTTTPGNPATAEIEFRALNGTGGTSVGDYPFEIEACDDGPDGGLCTTIEIVVRLEYPPTKTCDFGVGIYINEFAAQAGENYFQIYSDESGLVDLTTCSFVAFDGLTESIVVAAPLTYTLFPFAEPEQHTGVAFAGMIPSGPGAIAIVRGTPSVGDGVGSVLGDVVNGIVYYDDGNFTYDSDSIFAICGEGTLLGGLLPAAPCDSSAGTEALAAGLERLGQAVSTAAGPDGPLALAVAPNPAAHTAAVWLDLADPAHARVAVYDALGREVAVLVDRALGPGRHEATLDAAALPAGVYVVRAVAGAEVRAARITVAR